MGADYLWEPMVDFNTLPLVENSEPLDLRLPYADEWGGLVPDRDIEELQFIGNFIEPSEAGKLPVRHDWQQAALSFDDNGQPNKATYILTIHASDVMYVLPFIKGTAKISDDFPWRLSRLLPITDPDGFGMFATRVGNVKYENENGLIVMEVDPNDITPGVQPADAQPGSYEDGDVWNNNYSIFVGPYSPFDPANIPGYTDLLKRKVAKRFRYAHIAIDFEHVRYPIFSDNLLADDDDERWRYTTGTFTPSAEYINFQAGQMVWKPYQCSLGDPYDDTPMPPPADVVDPSSKLPIAVNNTSTLIRLTGEFKILWRKVPAEAIALLWPHWTGQDFDNTEFCNQLKAGTCNPEPDVTDPAVSGLIGKCNSLCFDIPVRSLFNQTTVVRCGPQTLLFNAPQLVESTDVRGFLFYDVLFSLTVRREGWNKFLNISRGQYWRARMYNPATKKLRDLYPPVDFNQSLFFLPPG